MCNCTDLPGVKRVGLREGPIDVLLTIVVDIQVPMADILADTALMSLILTLLSLIPTRLSLIPTLLSLTILSLIPTEDIMEDIRTRLGQSVDMSAELTVAQPDGVVINATIAPARHKK